MAKLMSTTFVALFLLLGKATGSFLGIEDKVEYVEDFLELSSQAPELGLVEETTVLGNLDFFDKCLHDLNKKLRPLGIKTTEMDLVATSQNGELLVTGELENNLYVTFQGIIKEKDVEKNVRASGVAIIIDGGKCSIEEEVKKEIPAHLDELVVVAGDDSDDDGERRLGGARRSRPRGGGVPWNAPDTCLDETRFKPGASDGPRHPNGEKKCWTNPTLACNDPDTTGWYTIEQDLEEVNGIVETLCQKKLDIVALCCDKEFELVQGAGTHTLYGENGYYESSKNCWDVSACEVCEDQPRSMYGVWFSHYEDKNYELLKLHAGFIDVAGNKKMRRSMFQRLLVEDANVWDKDQVWKQKTSPCYPSKGFVEDDCGDTTYECSDPPSSN